MYNVLDVTCFHIHDLVNLLKTGSQLITQFNALTPIHSTCLSAKSN